MELKHPRTKLLRKKIANIVFIAFVTCAVTNFAATGAFSAQTTLGWNAPTTNVDGSAVTDLQGYKLYFGGSSGNYSQTIDVGNVTSYTLSNLSDGATYYFAVTAYDTAGVESGFSNEINKTFAAAPATYTITASAGSGGSIVPSGTTSSSQSTNGTTVITTVTVNSGATQTFNIVPNTGYSIGNVTVDGISVGAVTSYTFTNVSTNHTISATFTANVSTFTISDTAGTGGTVSPAGTTTVNSGGSLTVSITPTSGYSIADVKVDGVSVGAVASYAFNNVTANHTLAASFAASSTSTSTSSATSGNVVYAINCGGSQYTDSTGIVYQNDTRFSGGSTASTTAAISGTADQSLYQTWHYGSNFSYALPIANGNYSVTLKFADNLSTGVGQRAFNVRMEGKRVISNLDIFAKVGKLTAYDVIIPVTVSNGVLNIRFVSTIGNALINGIVVQKN